MSRSWIRTLVLVPEGASTAAAVQGALENAGCLVDLRRLTRDARDEIDAAWGELERGESDLLVVDESVESSDRSVRSRLEQLRAAGREAEVVVLTRRDPGRPVAELQAAGALAVVDPDSEPRLLAGALAAIVDRRRALISVASARAEREATEDVLSSARARAAVTSSPEFAEVLEVAARVAPKASSVLLLGESGVGKEWLARAIHAASPRRASPFVALNCAAVPESLIESELFGHERGAFTGAHRARRGYFELAHGGTLLLDEIGEMPAALQARLLRVLQDRTVRRIGSERSLPVDVRILAATNRVRGGEGAEAIGLREDLYYRLAVVALEIPPLRQRRDDILPLFRGHLERLRRARDEPPEEVDGTLTPAAAQALREYTWPGNVRELLNVAERADLLSGGGTVDATHLPRQIVATNDPAPERHPGSGSNSGSGSGADDPGGAGAAPTELAWRALGLGVDCDLEALRQRAVEPLERLYLERLLADTGGNLAQTARRAGIDPRTLYNKMRRHRLDKSDYRGCATARERPGAEPPTESRD
ncbi:MAG: AAA family ATPase [Acidobacteria bacterium]|nr:MAG: AAA family ATPase [Acidobacteriota bacterium]REK07364.1 MAG: AAA family ATPase [Acidobacteriota bacterium]